MPNWAESVFIATGDKIEARDLYEKMESLAVRKTPLVEESGCKTGLANLVALLGGDYKTIYCRGEFLDWDIDCDDGAVRFTTMSAWGEPDEVIKLLQEKYPNLDFYFRAEEPGNNHFVTNDSSGEYFPEHYKVESWGNGISEEEYYEELEDAFSAVSKITGTSVSNRKEMYASISEYQKSNTNAGICVYEFKLTDTAFMS